MVNMPPAMRCTSPGGLRIAGSPKVTMKVTAAPSPAAAADTTTQTPSHSTMPTSPANVTGPKIVNGQVPRYSRSDMNNIMNEPINCAPLSQPSVTPIMSPRPVWVR